MSIHENRLFTYAIMIVIFLIFAAGGVKSLHPSVHEHELQPSHTGGDLIIMIEYESNPVDIELISPSDEVANTEILSSGRFVTYIVRNAEAGTWKMRYNESKGQKFTYVIKSNL